MLIILCVGFVLTVNGLSIEKLNRDGENGNTLIDSNKLDENQPPENGNIDNDSPAESNEENNGDPSLINVLPADPEDVQNNGLGKPCNNCVGKKLIIVKHLKKASQTQSQNSKNHHFDESLSNIILSQMNKK